jgi:hypothetical protein
MMSLQNVSLSWIRSVPQPCCRGCSLQGVAGGGDVAALGGGEEVEVFGGPRREVLREQGRSPGEQESLAGGQRQEQSGDLQLEGG